MKRLALSLLALGLALPASAAEFYRWTDADGQVHYSDQPPPAKVKQLKRLNAAGPGSGQSKSGPPVTLYSGNCGATCEQAADFLRQRGVPFSVKMADKSAKLAQELKQRTGAMEVPVLFIGESMQRGYSPSVWDKMLEVAGYPGPAKKAIEPEDAAAEPAKD